MSASGARHLWRITVVALVLSALHATASARDLESLSKMLAPAYTAMNLASLCMMEPGWTVTQPSGARGGAVQYAQHVKYEISVRLSYAEAVKVLRAAADAARAEARRQLRQHVTTGEKSSEPTRFRTWCNGPVRVMIEDFIAEHDEDHAAFEDAIERAIAANAI